MDRVTAARMQYVTDLEERLELRSSDVVRAFATVPRERFVGEGPWLLSGGDPYLRTPDADPARLYADVLVALDAERELNNGRPSSHALWMDRLGVRKGDRVLHVGAGTGYYTAILAEIVGPEGAVIAAEVNPLLLPRLRQSMATIPHVRVVEPRGIDIEFDDADRIYVNCSLTRPPASWMERLRARGSMTLPLMEMSSSRRHGGVFRVQRTEGPDCAAAFLSQIRMFPCEGGRHAADEPIIAAAFERGGEQEVRSLRSSAHDLEPSCWLHAETFCLSRRAAQE